MSVISSNSLLESWGYRTGKIMIVGRTMWTVHEWTQSTNVTDGQNYDN